MVVLCAVVSMTPAHSIETADPRPGVADVRERPELPLDIERVRAARSSAITGTQVAMRLHFYEPFRNAHLDLVKDEHYAIAIGVTLDSDRAFERLVYVHVRGDHADQDGLSPYAVVTKGKRMPVTELDDFLPRERFLGYALVRRPDEDSLEVTIPAPLLSLPPSRRFHWQVRTISSVEAVGVFYDYAPDDRLAPGRGRK